jgi:hypothetical protein
MTRMPAFRAVALASRRSAPRLAARISQLSSGAVPPAGLADILLKEPAGLSIGKVKLADGAEVLGVLGEPALCDGQKEITSFGSWRAYTAGQKP